MKKLILLALVLVGVSGCDLLGSENSENKSEEKVEKGESYNPSDFSAESKAEEGIEEMKVEDFASEEVETVKENAACGQNIGICASGLACLPKETGSQSRICRKAIVDESLECDVADVAYVCAERFGEPTTFLNTCFADAHGATVVSQGICKK